jgi:hypothetical protein
MKLTLAAALLAATSALAQADPAPAAFGVAGRAVILGVHAEGAQIYECKADAAGHLAWAFREPVAALFKDGESVGRHYAGPHWALDDGSLVRGKLAATAPGAGPGDVTLLKLDVVENSGAGALKDAALVLRLATRGGALSGDCPAAGALRPVPYSADYVFLR